MTRRPLARLYLTMLEDRWTPAAAGTLDPGFGTGGLAPIPAPEATNFFVPKSLIARPGGGAVVSGVTSTTPFPTTQQDTGLVRFTPAGRPDPTFGTNGQVFALALGLQPNDLRPVVETPDGGLILLGSPTGYYGLTALYKLTAAGQRDTAFISNGVELALGTPGVTNYVLAAAVALPDGRLIVAGGYYAQDSAPAGFLVVRLLSDGRPDPTFGTNGATKVPAQFSQQTRATVTAVSVDPSGRVAVAGSAAVGTAGTVPFINTLTDPAVVRLLADGRPDPTFGTNGLVRFDTPDLYFDAATGVAALPDGRVLVVADDYAQRLTTTGQPDPSYGTNGKAAIAGTAAVFPDGQVVALGSTGPGFRRLTADGQPDQTYSDAATQTSSSVGDIVPGPDGSVYLTDYSNAGQRVARILGTSNPFPVTAGTVLVGGSADGSATPLTRATDGPLQPAVAVTLYPNFPGNVRTATADVTGDGVLDLIAGPGPGGGPNVVILDGATGERFADFNSFETTFTGGVFVTAADLNGDGRAEVVVTPDQGGGPVVAVYDGARLAAGQNAGASLARFLGIEDAAFRGGARPAVADVNGDGTPDLVVAAGFGGGPRVAVYDGRTVLASGGLVPRRLVADFFVFEQTLRKRGVCDGGRPDRGRGGRGGGRRRPRRRPAGVRLGRQGPGRR